MFNYDQIQHLSRDLNSFLTGSTLIDCISKDYRQVLLIFEQKNQLRRLLLCFKKPFIRFHLVSHAYESNNELPHEDLQRYLSGTTLKSVEAMNQDRIVQFQFCSNSKSFFLICEFFSKHPNYYVTDSDYHILYSLHPSKQNIYYFPPSNPLSLHSNQVFNHAEIEKYYADLEKQQLFEEEKKRLEKELKKNLNNIYARKTKLIQSIEACKNWESAQHEGDLIKANLGLFKKGNSI